MATKEQRIKFIRMIAPLAIKEYRSGKKILPSVCIAQACCESGYGTSAKMVNANAVFGVKVGKSKWHFGDAWKDKAYSTKTKECYDGKTYTEITDMFRAYDSIADSVTDYYDMLCSCSRYRKAVGAADYVKTITEIKNGGYATSPTYINTICSIIKSNNLTQYDTMESMPQEEVLVTPYAIGRNYILQNNMYVRRSAAGEKKPFLELTVNAKSHAKQDAEGKGILKKGTVVTCQKVQEVNGAIWIKIPSGWICGISATGKRYVL